jgi:hypothetical protein
MTDEPIETDDAVGHDGLYLRDCEIARKLGFGRKFGYRLLERLERGIPNMRAYPKRDKMFGDRRFWPAVLAWHMDYHRVSRAAEAAGIQPAWEENFDAPASRKAKGPQHARPQLAASR